MGWDNGGEKNGLKLLMTLGKGLGLVGGFCLMFN